MMKKLTSLLLSVVLLVSLLACGALAKTNSTVRVAGLKGQVRERVRVLHLNSKNRLIRDDLVSEGSIDQAAIYTREVIRRAIDLGTAALILVHNHPSGDCSPSRQDIALTRDIIEAGKRLGIAVHDHIIIGMDGHYSMRGSGVI